MNKELKVCFFVQWLKTGGAERTISNLSNEFVSKNILVDIVLLGNTIEFDLDKKIKIITISDFNGHENVLSVLKKQRKRKKAFTDYCLDNKPDIIICLLNSVLIYIDRKINIPIVSSERSNPYKEIKLLRRIISFHLYKRCDGLIFQTKKVQQRFPKCFKKNSIVIPNPIVNIFEGYPKNYKERENKIVAVGRLHKSKGYFLLISAFKSVLKTHPNYILEIYGDGEEKNNIIRYIKKHNLEKSIILCGNNRDIIKKIINAKCYVLSSKYEGMPNSLLEAMSFGIPCVANDCDFGPSEIIKNGENGLLTSYNDVNELASGICRMLDDELLSNRCSINAIKSSQHLLIDNIGNQYLEYINKIMEAKNETL